MNATRRRALGVAVVVLCLEVLIATTFGGRTFVRGSLGDFFAVFVVYFGLLSVRPWAPRSLAVVSFGVAALLEIAQAFGLASRLHLARGGVLHTVLGATFSWADLVMYALGCAASVAIDSRFLRPAA